MSASTRGVIFLFQIVREGVGQDLNGDFVIELRVAR